jgi:gas vesicle protein
MDERQTLHDRFEPRLKRRLSIGLLVGALIGSFAGLESPDPGEEPSDTSDPLSIEERGGPDLSGVRERKGDDH